MLQKIYWKIYTLLNQRLDIKKSFSKNDFDVVFRNSVIKNLITPNACKSYTLLFDI